MQILKQRRNDNTNKILTAGGCILPSLGDSQLMCKCGNRAFHVGVTPRIEDGKQRADLHELVCIQCNKSLEVRVDGLLNVDGEFGKETVRHWESDKYKSTWSDMT